MTRSKSLFRLTSTRLLVLCVILDRAPASGQELVLDLTQATEINSESSKSHCFGWGGGLGGADHGPPPPMLPLDLQVVSLSSSTYKEGDDVAAELLLTSETDKAILIPSSLSPDTVYTDGCKEVALKAGTRALFANVSLTFEDEHGFWEAIAGAFTYGLSDDPKTYIELPPGKSLRIKTAGKVQLYNMLAQSQKANVALRFPLQLKITAKFDLDDPTFRGYRPVTSSNQLTISIEGK